MPEQPKPKVLIINDDENERKSWCKSIEAICEVVAPESHDSLFDLLVKGPRTYAIVILDYIFDYWTPRQSPFNGRDVLEMLRTNKEDRPTIILLTRYFLGSKEIQDLKRDYRDYHIYNADSNQTTPAAIYDTVRSLLGRMRRDSEQRD